MLEENFKEIAELIAIAIEAGAVAVVTYGAVEAIFLLTSAIAKREPTAYQGRVIWLKFATWILLALEFALAADIVRTAIAPTWNDIGKLAAIAIIRTVLNYFLAKDIAAFSETLSQSGGEEAGILPPRPKTRRRSSKAS
ncbi:DUF1622 domain-containing protein [Methyloligella solikamskensis]|uniref:DUF1622 domain-containing protein n=1 Tax=Methyloligella solikamskensis TaxID=1177756 RepID=A0ABW3J838_9HYPH